MTSEFAASEARRAFSSAALCGSLLLGLFSSLLRDGCVLAVGIVPDRAVRRTRQTQRRPPPLPLQPCRPRWRLRGRQGAPEQGGRSAQEPGRRCPRPGAASGTGPSGLCFSSILVGRRNRRSRRSGARIRLKGHGDRLPRFERFDQAPRGLGDVIGRLVQHEVAQQIQIRGISVSTTVEGRGTSPLASCCGLRPVRARYSSATSAAVSWKEATSRELVQTGVGGGLHADPEDRDRSRAGVDEEPVGIDQLMAHTAPPGGLETGRGLSDDRARRLRMERPPGQQRRERRGGGRGYSTTVVGPSGSAGAACSAVASRGSSSTTISWTGSRCGSSTR